MNSYEISRKWFDWCFDNASKIKPIHSALLFFIIEHNNRLGWKKEFGLPRNMVMDAIGVKNNRTFTSAFSDLEDWGFISVLERSKNQHSANIISLSAGVKNTPATTKALDKAMQKHLQKQRIGIAPIDKHINKETINNIDVDMSEDLSFKIKQLHDRFKAESDQGMHTMALEQMYMRLKIRRGSLKNVLADFLGQLIITNKLHKNTQKFLEHFNNYCNTQDRLGKLDEYKTGRKIGSL